MWILSFFNWKVCVLVLVVMITLPLIFIPIGDWNNVFWDFFNETPIVEWIGQLGMLFFFAALITITISTVQEVFF